MVMPNRFLLLLISYSWICYTRAICAASLSLNKAFDFDTRDRLDEEDGDREEEGDLSFFCLGFSRILGFPATDERLLYMLDDCWLSAHENENYH